VAGGEAEALPVGVAAVDGSVLFAETIARYGALDGRGDFGLRGPDVFEKNRPAGGIAAQRIGVEVVADAAGERVGDDERRAHEVIGADIDVDAALEVAIAAEHADGDEAVVFNGFGN